MAGKYSIDSLKKAVILGKSHVIRKALCLKIEDSAVGVTMAQETCQEEKVCDKRKTDDDDDDDTALSSR
jgi:hypothetical protein